MLEMFGDACSQCHLKPIKFKHNKSKYSSWCVECYKIQRKWQNKDHKLKKLFGPNFGFQEYIDLFQIQKGLCKRCGKPELARSKYDKNRPKLLAVDHDHITGEIRGLLCQNCNTGQGLLFGL